MSFRAKTVMFAIMNVFMAASMSITADIINGALSLRTALMTAIGFLIGMVLCYLIPYDAIGRKLCHALGCDDKKIPGRLLSNAVPALINTFVIGAVMTAINVPPSKVGFGVYFGAFFSIVGYLTIVAYIVAFFANPVAVRAGIFVDRKIKKEDGAK